MAIQVTNRSDTISVPARGQMISRLALAGITAQELVSLIDLIRTRGVITVDVKAWCHGLPKSS